MHRRAQADVGTLVIHTVLIFRRRGRGLGVTLVSAPVSAEATVQPRGGLACSTVREGVGREGKEIKADLTELPHPAPGGARELL